MEEQEFWIEVLKIAQSKYRCASEVSRITQEIAEALSRDDRVSTQMLLGMRQEEMDKWEKSLKDMEVLERAYPPELQNRLQNLLKTRTAKEPCTPEEIRIAELLTNTHTVIGKAIEIDKHLNTKIAGKDSYYSESQT